MGKFLKLLLGAAIVAGTTSPASAETAQNAEIKKPVVRKVIKVKQKAPTVMMKHRSVVYKPSAHWSTEQRSAVKIIRPNLSSSTTMPNLYRKP